MTTKSVTRSLVAIGLLSAGALAGWFVRARADSEPKIALESTAAQNPNSAISISTSTVSSRKLNRHIDAVGSVHAYEDLVIAAKSEGRVLRVLHDMADLVQPNAMLLEIDPTDMRLAVSQAQRALKTECEKWGFNGIPNDDVDLDKIPSVRSSFMRLELAQSKLLRFDELIKSKSVSIDEFEQIKFDARILESDWENQKYLARAALATVRLRESELEIAQQRLTDTQVFAPLPTADIPTEDRIYRVAQRMVTEGSHVRPGDPLFRLVLGRSVKVRLNLQEVHSSSAEVGQDVTLESFQGNLSWNGKVTRVSPVIDPATRTFVVEVEVRNENGQLKPGGFAKARIVIGQEVDAITIPLAALDSFAGVHKIFVIENQIATEHQVKLGYQQDDWIEVLEPQLQPGAMIATSSQRLLSTGVSVVDRDLPKDAP